MWLFNILKQFTLGFIQSLIGKFILKVIRF